MSCQAWAGKNCAGTGGCIPEGMGEGLGGAEGWIEKSERRRRKEKGGSMQEGDMDAKETWNQQKGLMLR